MAIQEVSLALIAFIPGEILFGSLVDSACTLWNEVGCGKTGHCLDYNLPGRDEKVVLCFKKFISLPYPP